MPPNGVSSNRLPGTSRTLMMPACSSQRKLYPGEFPRLETFHVGRIGVGASEMKQAVNAAEDAMHRLGWARETMNGNGRRHPKWQARWQADRRNTRR